MTSGSIDGLGAARPRALAQAGSARATRAARAIWARPELMLALGVAAALNLWGLSRNGWANTFYAGAVRSMASSWHNFLFASLDRLAEDLDNRVWQFGNPRARVEIAWMD